MSERKHVVIGGGPAGLTAAYVLARRGRSPIVLEKDAQVGGIARTVEYKGFRFDIGGHRFFTKVDVGAEALAEDAGAGHAAPAAAVADLLQRQVLRLPAQGDERAARHRHRRRRCACSSATCGSAVVPIKPEASFEDWVVQPLRPPAVPTSSSRRTRRRSGAFPCNEIGAQWAAQRIKGLSLRHRGARTCCAANRRRQRPASRR